MKASLRRSISVALMHDLEEMQPLMVQWSTAEPALAQGLKAIGDAANTCCDAQRKLVDLQKHSVAVVSAAGSRLFTIHKTTFFFSHFTSMPCTLSREKML